jgi:Domain of unknown function (DUF1772)
VTTIINQYMPEILLWLFVMNLGIAYGAGLYEKRIFLPQWFSKSEESEFRVNGDAMRQTNTGLRFWAYITTVPLTVLTLANLVVALQSQAPRHDWWLAAAIIILVERIATFAFFIPSAIQLMNAETLPAATVSKMVSRWVRLNYVRDALTLIGWLAALKTFSLPQYAP